MPWRAKFWLATANSKTKTKTSFSFPKEHVKSSLQIRQATRTMNSNLSLAWRRAWGASKGCVHRKWFGNISWRWRCPSWSGRCCDLIRIMQKTRFTARLRRGGHWVVLVPFGTTAVARFVIFASNQVLVSCSVNSAWAKAPNDYNI